MTITQNPDTFTPPAWLAAAIDRREKASEAEQLKRRTDARRDAEAINTRLKELGITAVEAAHWTPGGYLVHARLIQSYALGEDQGVTAGLHDGTVSVFVDSGDDDYPALTRHTYVGPLTSADDVVNAVYSGVPKPAPEPIDHAAQAEHHLLRAAHCLTGSEDERYNLGAAQAHATLATRTDRATVTDLRYRLAAIERLIVPIATLSTDGLAALVGSAVHEIARGARTPEDALTLLPPDWSTILSGLTR